MNKIDALNEIILEDSWRISRKLMQEIERELECEGKLPVNILLASQNLVIKWNEFTRLN